MAMDKRENPKDIKDLRNEDPISGAAGAHPVGTGVGAALGGAATGAAAGAVGGPIGAAVGTIVGAVAGGLAGKGVAENIDPTVEVDYWRNEYQARPYYSNDYTFDDYEPAYRAGIESYDSGSPSSWDETEAAARARWEKRNRDSRLTWTQARNAAKDAYDRVHTRVNKPR
jgi:hypothetical protein